MGLAEKLGLKKGIDLPDLGEIIDAIKGNPEPLNKAWDSFFDSIFEVGSEFADEWLATIRANGVERLLKRWWPNAPVWAAPLLRPIAEAIIDAIIEALKKRKPEVAK
jgi:hypothetical protein